MKERPIIMRAESVLGILADRKTQTRRIAKFPSWVTEVGQVGKWFEGHGIHPRGKCDGAKCVHIGSNLEPLPSCYTLTCPYGVAGDRLWVRETYYPSEDRQVVAYRADSEMPTEARSIGTRWKGPMMMPRWASRITLEITEIRVQRLQEISEGDAIAEGFNPCAAGNPGNGGVFDWYRNLWESINGPGSWSANPWVWAVSFRRAQQ